VDLRVTVDPDLPELLNEPVVAFGSFTGSCAGLTVYAPGGPGSPLSRLYVDLICGRSLPLTFVARSAQNLATVVAASLFLDRELCLHPMAAALVSAVELATQLQEGGLAHVDRDLARLFLLVDGYFCAAPMNREEQGRRLGQVVEWLRGYVLHGTLPALPRPAEPPTIIDRGTNGFVLATGTGRLVDAVIELYRQGHLRGVVFHRLESGREMVLAFRKSPYVRFDLQAAEVHLNAAEASLGHPGGWKLNRFLLAGPETGTAVSREDVIQTFLRV
jgi:hypothetical protein